LKRIGKYELQKKVGAGGMGTVFLALDTQLKRTVALKVLPHEKAQNPTLIRRFHAEARAAAQLKHDHIVTVYEAGEVDGYHFIAMEFIDGIDVADLVERRGVIPVRRATDIIKQVTEALQCAHAAGIVHRDIKPANLMIRRNGMVKLTDMGLARAVDDASQTNITRAGTTLGTVDYMSPEQAQDSKSADTRSDIYSLGCTWYHMLTGQSPFPEGSLTNKLHAHAHKPPPDPRVLNPKVPDALVAVMYRMMAKRPEDRHQTPAELLEDIERCRAARENMDESVLAALADEDATADVRRGASPADSSGSIPVYRSKSSAPTTQRPSTDKLRHRSARVTPPRERTELVIGVASEDDQDRDYTKLLYAGIGVVIIAAIAGVAWIVQNYSGAVEMQPIVVPMHERPDTSDKGSDNVKEVTSSTTDPNVQQITPQNRTQPGDKSVTQPTAKNINETLITKSPNKSGSSTEIKSTGTGKGSIVGSGGTSTGIRDLRYQKDFPVWVGEQRLSRNLVRFVVNPGTAGPNVYPTLEAALAAVPVSGADIELAGSGPFPLRPVAITGRARIIVHGQGNARPMILLLPPRRPAAVATLIHVALGSLELSGVDLALDAKLLPATQRVAIIRVSTGNLYVEDCSLAVVGATQLDVVALQIDDAAPKPAAAAGQTDPPSVTGRVLFARSSLRGSNVTGLLCQSASLDAVIRESLFVTRGAAAIQFDQAAGASDSDERLLLVVHSTLSSAGRSFVMSTRNNELRERTDVKLLNSVVAAEPGAPEPTLLTVDGWTRANASSLLANFVEWKSSGTAFLGWRKLAVIQPDGAIAVATPADWQKRWKDGGSPEQFAAAAWPTAPLDDFVRLIPDQVDPASIGNTALKTDQGWPGCPIDVLRFGDLSGLTAAIEQSVRPDLPLALLQSPATTKTIHVDPASQDLGKFVASQKFDDGTIVIVAGSGAHQTSPVTVQGRRLHLRFQHDPDRPLMLMPKLPPGSREIAMFNVSNGTLELENAVLVSYPPDKPTPEKPAAPTWFIQGDNSHIVLRRCRVQAPLTTGTGNRGLVRWLRSEPVSASNASRPDLDHHLALFDTFLLGSGILLDLDVRRRGVFVQNCVLASRDNIFAFSLGSQNSDIGGSVDINSSTLAAGDAVFKVQGGTLPGPASNPLACYVEYCAFGPSIRPGTGKLPPVTLLVHQGPVLEQRQITWWERGNAYASDIAYFVQAAGAEKPPAVQAIGPAWQSLWGPERVLQSLTGEIAVKYDADLPPNRGKLEPDDFELSPKCRAATWVDGQYAVGADVATMKLPDLRVESGTTKAPKKTKPKAPVRPRPGF
jgi:serine/threonine-protein kinase